jgi:cation:H+ antiporter
MNFIYLFIFILSCLLLAYAGGKVVRSITRIARFLKLKEFIVAFILMAFATTIPEFLVGITSAFHGKPALSFGNIIGSNIVNLTLVVAIGIFFAGRLDTRTSATQTDAFYTALISSLPILLLLDKNLSRTDGIILLLALLVYLRTILRQKHRFDKIFANNFQEGWPKIKIFLRNILVFFAGIVLLLLAAEGIVWSASSFAEAVGLPLVIIGILVIALGTNLPEITFGIKSALMGHKQMILGNIMGAVVINSTLILGLTVIICPLTIVDFSAYFIGIIFTIGIALFFGIFIQTHQIISKKEGIFLFLIYLLFVFLQIFLG